MSVCWFTLEWHISLPNLFQFNSNKSIYFINPALALLKENGSTIYAFFPNNRWKLVFFFKLSSIIIILLIIIFVFFRFGLNYFDSDALFQVSSFSSRHPSDSLMPSQQHKIVILDFRIFSHNQLKYYSLCHNFEHSYKLTLQP